VSAIAVVSLPGSPVVRLQALGGDVLASMLASAYGPEPESLLVALELAAATDPLLERSLLGLQTLRSGDLRLIAAADRPWLLAPFGNTGSSRWSSGGRGCWYGAESLYVAQSEVGFHLAARCRIEQLPSQSSFSRMNIAATLTAWPLDDLRTCEAADLRLSALTYIDSQPYGDRRARQDSAGIIWPSVRDAGRGLCVVAFRPVAIENVTLASHPQRAEWDGTQLTWSQ
jgi:RES domain